MAQIIGMDLLKQASEDMNIVRGTREKEIQWELRVVYSAIANMAYASLWDQIDENDHTSVTHFNHRIQETLEGWKNAVPSIKHQFGMSAEDLSNEFLYLFEQGGVVYRHPYRIAPAQEKIADGKKCVFVRSPLLSRDLHTSGAGYYSLAKIEKNSSLPEMFDIDLHSLEDIADHYLNGLSFHPLSTDLNAQYFILEKRKGLSQWGNTPASDGEISLMRVSNMALQTYYFYKMENQRIVVSQIPSWLTDNGMYRYLSTALMKKYGKLPNIDYTNNGSIVLIHQNYLLPPNELSFLSLYSWPVTFFTGKQLFRRVMAAECFPDFQQLLEEKGFAFKEV